MNANEVSAGICAKHNQPLFACPKDCNSVKKETENTSMPKEVESFQEGIEIAFADINKLVKELQQAVISVSGKTGSGKSEFSRQLKRKLLESGIPAAIISTDDFIVKKEQTDTLRHDSEKIQETIAELKSRAGQIALIIEGLETYKPEVLGITPDYKIYAETDFDQRMARRLIRDEKMGFRDIPTTMKYAVHVAVKNPAAILNFEKTPEIPDLNLLVHNDFKQPGEPELFISGNNFTFINEGSVVNSIELNEIQKEALEKIGINVKS